MNGSRRSLRKHLVDLVDEEDDGPRLLRELIEHALILVRPAQRLDDEQIDVRVLQRRERRAIHVAVHGAPGAGVQARRIDENDLRVGPGQNAEDAMPRRLRLRADDRLIFCPSSALSSVDLPTFGRPTIAAKPQRKPAGSSALVGLLRSRLFSLRDSLSASATVRGGLLRPAATRAARCDLQTQRIDRARHTRTTDYAPRPRRRLDHIARQRQAAGLQGLL